MVANGGNTEGLFRGAFMESGVVPPIGDASLGQQDYDEFVRKTGCAGTEDTLECLRQAPFSVLKAAVDSGPGTISYRVCHGFLDPLSSVVNYFPQSVNLIWRPRADGTFLEAPLQQLVLQGSVADIPFVTGNKTTYPFFLRCD
jgi:acetylcholinesterase